MFPLQTLVTKDGHSGHRSYVPVHTRNVQGPTRSSLHSCEVISLAGEESEAWGGERAKQL